MLVSCKSTRTVTKTNAVKSGAIEQLIQKVQETQPQFKTANIGKMTMALDYKNNKYNVSLSCKIKKDSALYISVQPFMGIEMFKAEITADTIRVFDKLNKRLYISDYINLSKKIGINVDYLSLQSLILNQFFCIGQNKIVIDSCKLVTLPTGNSQINFDTESIAQTTNVATNNAITQVALKSKSNNSQLLTNYSDFQTENGITFPKRINMIATNQKTSASCDFDILKIEFNGEIKLTPTNSNRFTRVNIDQLLKK
jgi:hypothetical protein